LIKGIVETSGSNTNVIKERYKQCGDLGLVAMNSKGKQKTLGFGVKPKPLLASEVLECFRKVANTSGSKSGAVKIDFIKKILVRATGVEAKYIIRGLQGKLRIGLAKSSVLVSLAHAFVLTVPEFSEELPAPTAEELTDYPDNAQLLISKKMKLDERLAAAANIMRKAHSEASR